MIALIIGGVMHINVTHDIALLNEQLKALNERLKGDLTPVMDNIGAILENGARKRFESKTDPKGKAWEGYKEGSRNAKRKKSEQLLIEGRHLLDSLTYHASSQSVAVGVSMFYGKYHQLGTNHLPARPFLGISAEEEANINETLAGWLQGAFK